MRALIIGPDEQQAIQKVVAFASEPDHWFSANAGWIPGESPDYVVRVPDGFRCVFTLTKHEGKLYRHLTISVNGPLYPAPEACVALATEFGFTSSGRDEFNLTSRSKDDGWFFNMGHPGEHCIAIGQPIEESK